MDKQEILDILNTIYIRAMRLRFSCKIFSHIFHMPVIFNYYPNLCWGMKVSFATDAYTTIDGLMHSGKYSFATLAEDNKEINTKYNATTRKMEEIIPNIRKIRNRMFCHLVWKQTDDVIEKMNAYCFKLVDCLIDLHEYCCRIYEIDESELDGYNNDAFEELNKEFTEFDELLMNGRMLMLRNTVAKIQAGESVNTMKQVRHKQIKSEDGKDKKYNNDKSSQ